jgi:mannan endo-1,4-beta-mannosidase
MMMHTFRSPLIISGSALVMLSCATDPGLPVAEPGPTAVAQTTAAAPQGFVKVSGRQLVVDGRPYTFCGVNFWAAMNLAADGETGDRQRLLAELDHLQRLGITNLRVMAASEGPDSEPYRMVPALLVEPGRYNQSLLAGLDFLLAECRKRDQRVVMVLNNFWEWSGGMAQYVSWDTGTEIPYSATHSWPEVIAYSARFYSSQRCQQWYRDHIRTLIERVNSLTGISYSDDPTIFAWELANEPRLYPQSWIDDTAAFIKQLDPNHLVTTGSEGRVGGDFIPTHDGEHIDYATLHIWPQNWEWFDPQKPETFQTAESNARSYLDEHVAMADQLGKPLVLEEFGLARDWHQELDNHDPSAPTTLRDRFFKAMLDGAAASVRAGGPLAGTAIWAWSGKGRPGEPWIGDPPHERPGWYSVYDHDASTLAILSGHAAELRTATGN